VRQLLGKVDAREPGGSERDHFADSLDLYGKHVEADRKVAARLWAPQVDAEGELAVGSALVLSVLFARRRCL
jgi:hypothetical protein